MWWLLSGWAVGLITTAYPTLASGFARVQGGLGDTRLVNLVLEHGYRWVTGLPLAADLWSLPVFYPTRGTSAYTDLLLGVGPLYWPWRWLGADPHTAYQLWMLTGWTLNYLVFYLLLRMGLRVSPAGAVAGAYLFAFGSARMAGVMHQQLVFQVFIVTTVLAVVELVRRSQRPPDPRAGWLWAGVLQLSLLAQLATAVYPLIFLEIALLVTLLVATLTPVGRATLRGVATRHWLPLAAWGAAVGVAAVPIVRRYWEVAQWHGVRPYMPDTLPRPLSWALMGPLNLCYGWLHDMPVLAWAEKPDHNYGVGMVTLVVCVIGLWKGRHRPMVRMVVLVVAGMFLLTVRFPWDFSLWGAARDWFPGATALRAMARVAMTGLWPAAFGLALAVHRLVAARRWTVVATLAAVVVLEQVQLPRTWDKGAEHRRVTEIAAAVPDDAECFVVVTTSGPMDPYVQEDAEWAALASGIPTLNGRLGVSPPHWRLARVHVGNRKLRREVEERLNAWIQHNGLNPERVARVEVPPRPRPRKSRWPG
jgi:hypothetical protein